MIPETAFICYARADGSFVLPLARALENRGIRVWLDQWNVQAGADWDLSIEVALANCHELIIILSPVAMESQEVRGELRVALDLHKPILPVLFRDCTVPRQLRMTQCVDFRGVAATDEAQLSALVAAISATRTSSGHDGDQTEQRTLRPPLIGLRTSHSIEAQRSRIDADTDVDPPDQIRLATRLMWGVFVIEFLLWLIAPKWGPREINYFGLNMLVVIGIDLGSLAWLIFPVTQGRNWARYAYAPVFLFRFLALLELPTLAKASLSTTYFTVHLGLVFGQLFIGLFALYLTFFGAGAMWFERKRRT